MGKVLDSVISFTESHMRRGQLFMEECEYTECEVYKSSQNNLLENLEIMQKEYYYGKKDVVLDIATLVNNRVSELDPAENKKSARVS